jgi:hypothetical protein
MRDANTATKAAIDWLTRRREVAVTVLSRFDGNFMGDPLFHLDGCESVFAHAAHYKVASILLKRIGEEGLASAAKLAATGEHLKAISPSTSGDLTSRLASECMMRAFAEAAEYLKGCAEI